LSTESLDNSLSAGQDELVIQTEHGTAAEAALLPAVWTCGRQISFDEACRRR
jgi:hypothetical protein